MGWDLTHSKELKSDLLSALRTEYDFMDMVVNEELKTKSNDYSLDGFASKRNSKDRSSPSKTDDKNEFMDMVMNPTLKRKSKDYSSDSEDKKPKFSGSKDQGIIYYMIKVHECTNRFQQSVQ